MGFTDSASQGLGDTALALGAAALGGLLLPGFFRASFGGNTGFNSGFAGGNCGGGGTVVIDNNMAQRGATMETMLAGALSKVAALEGQNYADKVALETYKQSVRDDQTLSDRAFNFINPIAKEVSDLLVREARNDERINCINKDIHNLRHEFRTAIEIEGERRITGLQALECYVKSTYVPGQLKLSPDSLCPQVMPRYNSFTLPTDTAPAVQPVTGNINVT